MLTRFFLFLAPVTLSFSAEITHAEARPRNYLDKHPDQVWRQLRQK
jgi:hypothetical protein